MGLIENFKDVAELVKKAGNIDLYQQITALESQLIDLTRTNRHLELENEELKAQLAIRAKMSFKNPFWFVEGDDVPCCPRCWEHDSKAIHVQGPMEVGSGTRYDCPQCKEMFITNRREPVSAVRPRFR